ncbi:MAG: hypothetical protein AAF531_01495 [Actinomycetota bacterium]
MRFQTRRTTALVLATLTLLAGTILWASPGSATERDDRRARITELRSRYSGLAGSAFGRPVQYVEIRGVRNSEIQDLTLVILRGDASVQFEGTNVSPEFLDSLRERTGQLQSATDLSGTTIPGNRFLAVTSTPDSSLRFNSPARVLLVQGFNGEVGSDLDTDNDGTLDATPWTRIVDDVTLEAFHAYRCGGEFIEGRLNFLGNDTAGFSNRSQCRQLS